MGQALGRAQPRSVARSRNGAASTNQPRALGHQGQRNPQLEREEIELSRYVVRSGALWRPQGRTNEAPGCPGPSRSWAQKSGPLK